MKQKTKEILLGLKILQSYGFEIIKSNEGQIALNKKDNSMPLVMTNDINYLTPTPHQWHSIKKEIERLENEDTTYN